MKDGNFPKIIKDIKPLSKEWRPPNGVQNKE